MARRSLLTVVALAAAIGVCPPAAPRALASDCTHTATGRIPLTDLGAGTYLGFQGGLYAGGSNFHPVAHEAAGVEIARRIVPLDTLGNPDAANGRIVLISIGMSNATQEFSTFVPLAMGDPQRNPRLLTIDCAEGGQAASDMIDPSAPYWDFVSSRLRAAGSAPLQVQAVWLKQALRGPKVS